MQTPAYTKLKNGIGEISLLGEADFYLPACYLDAGVLQKFYHVNIFLIDIFIGGSHCANMLLSTYALLSASARYVEINGVTAYPNV